MFDRSICGGLGLAALLLIVSPTNAQPVPVQQPEWNIRCGPSPTEVATDCVAILASENARLAIKTLEGQLRLELDQTKCGSAQRNYDRQELLAMTAADRQALMQKALQEMAAETGRICRVENVPFDMDLAKLPDLAVFPLNSEQ